MPKHKTQHTPNIYLQTPPPFLCFSVPPTRSRYPDPPTTQAREAAVYDPSSYVSILKNHPVEWFDNSMSYGVFNWGLNPVGVSACLRACVQCFGA